MIKEKEGVKLDPSRCVQIREKKRDVYLNFRV